MTTGLPIARLTAGVRRRVDRTVRRRHLAAVAARGLDPLIIFSLPKTGGSTLHRSLQAGLDRPVHHVHILSDAGLADVDSHLGEAGYRVRPDKRRVMGEARAAIDDRAQRPIVLTAARQPLPRAVSWFFQNWHVDYPWLGEGGPVDPARTDELVDRFRERLPYALRRADTWFDDELASVTGVDVWATPFDRATGWQRFDADGCDVVAVRVEDLDRSLDAITTEMLGTTVRMRRTNEAGSKVYRDHHRAFLDRLRLSAAEADAVRSSRHARHFFTPDEVERTLRPHLDG